MRVVLLTKGGAVMEKKKVGVKINNIEYTLLTDEPEEYVQRVAVLVNKRMQQVMDDNPRLSTAMTAVLTAINLADDFLKNESVLDNLRVEMKGYMEEAKSVGTELESKRLEAEKLREDVHKLQIELTRCQTELSGARKTPGTTGAAGGTSVGKY